MPVQMTLHIGDSGEIRPTQRSTKQRQLITEVTFKPT